MAQPDITASLEARKWKTLDHNKLRRALLQSEVRDAANHPHSAEEYFDRYDSVVRSLFDEYTLVVKL